MTPPIWLDAAGRPRPTHACWTSGREVAPMRFRADLGAGSDARSATAVGARGAVLDEGSVIERLTGAPRAVPLLQGAETLYEIDLSVAPSPPWRAAFLRPPLRLTGIHATPALGRVGLNGATVYFRTTPDRLDAWLYRIEGWIAYANSVVAE